MQIAKLYNLTGYVKNLDNGDVITEVQGFGVDDFLKESLKDDCYIIVNDYSVKEIEIINNENSYKVIY